jgi:hypothetical protein
VTITKIRAPGLAFIGFWNMKRTLSLSQLIRTTSCFHLDLEEDSVGENISIATSFLDFRSETTPGHGTRAAHGWGWRWMVEQHASAVWT